MCNLAAPGSLCKHRGDTVQITARLCGQPMCPTCAPGYRKRVRRIAEAGRPSLFITFTVATYPLGLEWAQRQDMARSIAEFFRRLARELRLKHVPYFVTWEEHESGAPHAHALVRIKRFRWARAQRLWRRLTGASQIRLVEPKRTRDTARYVTKYVSKSLHAFGTAKRWYCTRDWVLDRGDDDPRRPRLFDRIIRSGRAPLDEGRAYAANGWRPVEGNALHLTVNVRDPPRWRWDLA